MNEKEINIKIEFAAFCFAKKECEVTIDDNMLNVSGEKNYENEEKQDDYTRKDS